MLKDISKFKLLPTPVPDSCWYSNLRTILPKKAWDILRKQAYAKANGRCMICGRPAKRLEAHELWSYDEQNCVQRLEDIGALCHDCHSVIHIGRTQLVGDEERAIKHFCRVNGCSYSDYIRALGFANERHTQLNKIAEWKLDASIIVSMTEGDNK